MNVLSGVIDIYIAVIVIRTVLSWLRPDPDIRSVHILYRITDPYLDRIRRVLPMVGSIDFSPAVGVIALLLIKELLKHIL